MSKRERHKQSTRIRILNPVLYGLIAAVVLVSAGCSKTPSVDRGGTLEISRKMDFYFQQGWDVSQPERARPKVVQIPADSEDAQVLLTGVEWELDDCMAVVESQVEIPPRTARITWKTQVLQDTYVRYVVDGLRVDAQATLSVGQDCAPGDYPIVLRMPALGIAADFLDANVYFPGKNAPQDFVAPDTLVVTTVQVK
jgi:hypothetical protein